MSFKYILNISFKSFLLVLFQVYASNLMEINEVVPNPLLIYLIFASMASENVFFATTLGFFSGFLLDLIQADTIGISSLVLVIVCFVAAMIGRENEKMTKTILGLTTGGLIAFHDFTFYSLVMIDNKFLDTLVFTFLPSLLYNLFLVIIITWLFPFKKKKKSF